MDLHLTDKVVVVTGGSSGVGLATVRALHDEGALIATCSRDPDNLHAAVESVGVPPERILAQVADVRSSREVDSFIQATIRKFGRIDGLVNNAGRSLMKTIHETSADEWADELDLKFKGILNPSSAALDALATTGDGAIVNINAVLSVQPEPILVATSAARAGVLNLSKSMAVAYADRGIRVNSVCLGLIDTGQWRQRYDASGSTNSYLEWQGELAADRKIPLGRLGSADEVANLIVFLLSDRASYITGCAYDVAGGINRGVH